MAAARFFIGGRVQGVAFRVYTRAQAHASGLRGYARNLDDGRVEVLAIGEPDAIEQLAAWLQRGPPLARVETVVRAPAEPEIDTQGFEIG
jgi:acylphosphatase